MKTHELKTLPEYFELVRTEVKNFEVRKNDRDFKVGDLLILKEWNGEYTGRDQRRKNKLYIGQQRLLQRGICNFGIRNLVKESEDK